MKNNTIILWILSILVVTIVIIAFFIKQRMESPPKMVNVCIESHQETRVVMIYNAATKTSMPQTQIHTVCDKYVKQCREPGSLYKGHLTCSMVENQYRQSIIKDN